MQPGATVVAAARNSCCMCVLNICCVYYIHIMRYEWMHLESRQPDLVQAPSGTSAAAAAVFFLFVTLKQVQVSLTPQRPGPRLGSYSLNRAHSIVNFSNIHINCTRGVQERDCYPSQRALHAYTCKHSYRVWKYKPPASVFRPDILAGVRRTTKTHTHTLQAQHIHNSTDRLGLLRGMG